MSATDAVRRLLVLVPWLLERPGAHVDEAAAAVGTDRSTVLADLALLDLCGLPGRLGGDLFETELVGDRVVLRLAPAFERPLRPTQTEALRLVLSLDRVAGALGDELPGLADAVDALRAAAGVPAGVRVLDDAGDAHLETARRGIAEGRALRLAYEGRGDQAARERDVDPWELVLHRGQWYLHAHDHGARDRRTFRLDRVRSMEVTERAARVPRPAGELPEPRYAPGPDDVRVELLVRPGGVWVLDVLAPDEVEHHPDGSSSVVVATDAPAWVEQVVLAARGEVVVRSPVTVRDGIVGAARAGLAAYAEVTDREGGTSP